MHVEWSAARPSWSAELSKEKTASVCQDNGSLCSSSSAVSQDNCVLFSVRLDPKTNHCDALVCAEFQKIVRSFHSAVKRFQKIL